MNLSLALRQSLLLSSAITATSATVGTRGGKQQRDLELAAADMSMSTPPVALMASGNRNKGGKAMKSSSRASDSATFSAPHEVHQYEQVKFFNEPEWECEFDSIEGAVGCMKCRNPGEIGDDALIVQVKAMYKRTNFHVKDEDQDPPRDHCIYPGRGYFWTCFNSNLVIEPDTDWLGSFKDKPIYDANGEVVDEGGQCLPGSIAATL